MSDFVHELVNSLSQTEKRYFKLYSSFSSENNKGYLQLFELIEKQKEYNEEKIKKQFGEKHFAQKKKHLIEKILESCRSYHQRDSQNNEIDNLIQESRQLIKRSFYLQAHKSIKKAETKAAEAELFTQQIRIKETETDLLRAEGNPEKLKEHINKLQNELPQLLSQIDTKLEIEKAFLSFVKFNQEIEFVRNSEQEKQLKTLLNAPILKSNHKRFSKTALINYHYIHAIYYYMQSEFELSYEQFKKQHQLFVENPILINEYGTEYSRSVSNLVYLAVKSKQNTASEQLAYLENLTELKNINQNQFIYWHYLVKLNFLVNTNKHSEAWLWYLKNRQEIENMESQSINATERNYSLFDSSLAGLLCNKHKEVKRNLTNYINDTEIERKPEALITARIIVLLIDLLLNNYSVNENELKSLIRLCKENGLYQQFEKTIIQFITQYGNYASAKDRNKLKEKLLTDLINLKKIRFEKNAFALFDLVKWLKSI